eukprot:3846979-Rhodomonas_salina.1
MGHAGGISMSRVRVTLPGYPGARRRARVPGGTGTRVPGYPGPRVHWHACRSSRTGYPGTRVPGYPVPEVPNRYMGSTGSSYRSLVYPGTPVPAVCAQTQARILPGPAGYEPVEQKS